MTDYVRDVMTKNPIVMPDHATVAATAQAMRMANIGDVLVMEDQRTLGIVTDRDLVVRVLAHGLDPRHTRLRQICTHNCITISPDDTVDDALLLMRRHHIRRLPVTDNGSPAGIVSLCDLARLRDPRSVLAEVGAQAVPI